MTNPYKSPTANAEIVRPPNNNDSAAFAFWMTHFITFQISFFILGLASAWVNLGLTEILEQVSRNQQGFLELVACGLGAWSAHAIFAFFVPGIRQSGAIFSAFFGSAFLIVGMHAINNCSKYLPPEAAQSISSAPDHFVFPLLVVLSLFLLWLFTLCRNI